MHHSKSWQLWLREVAHLTILDQANKHTHTHTPESSGKSEEDGQISRMPTPWVLDCGIVFANFYLCGEVGKGSYLCCFLWLHLSLQSPPLKFQLKHVLDMEKAPRIVSYGAWSLLKPHKAFASSDRSSCPSTHHYSLEFKFCGVRGHTYLPKHRILNTSFNTNQMLSKYLLNRWTLNIFATYLISILI
jgi:hypothetical protein